MPIPKKIYIFSENSPNVISFINDIRNLYPGYTIEALDNQALGQYISNTFGSSGSDSIITNTYNGISNSYHKQ